MHLASTSRPHGRRRSRLVDVRLSCEHGDTDRPVRTRQHRAVAHRNRSALSAHVARRGHASRAAQRSRTWCLLPRRRASQSDGCLAPPPSVRHAGRGRVLCGRPWKRLAAAMDLVAARRPARWRTRPPVSPPPLPFRLLWHIVAHPWAPDAKWSNSNERLEIARFPSSGKPIRFLSRFDL
eukprot:6293441-Prymnesium_polylepis.1